MRLQRTKPRSLGLHRFQILVAGVLIQAATGYAAPEFTFHEITIPSGLVESARDINIHGLVSGTVFIDGVSKGYIYSMAANTSLIYSVGAETLGYSINDLGAVVGSSSDNNGTTWTAYLRETDGTTAVLDHPFTPGASWGLIGLNNLGDTVGAAWDPARFTWVGVIQTGGVVRAVTLGEPEGHLTGINDLGWFVGYRRDPVVHFDGRAWIFRPDGALDAELIWDAANPLDNEMRAYDINNGNEVVGTVFRIHDGINQGWIRETDGDIHAISYPGSNDTWVEGINDAGDIAGRYADSEYRWHSFVGIRTIPEPGTTALLLAGFAMARIFRLRRKARCGDDART